MDTSISVTKSTAKFQGLNGNLLKLAAIIAMTVDHVAWTVFPGYSTEPAALIMHIIGRITAPIMCFFIAEGYYHTHNLKKYIKRLFIFAFISHFAYNFAFDIPIVPFITSVFNQTSVMWSLAWGLVALSVVKSENPKLKQWMRTVIVMLICAVSFCADWSCIGVLMVMLIGSNRGDFKKQMIGMVTAVIMYAVIYFFFIDKLYGVLQLGVVLAIPLLKTYNGERGSWKGMKWFFYIYYPLHLILCGVLRNIIAYK